ncbi:hypothetical protein D9M72_628160 [compost metagenome]
MHILESEQRELGYLQAAFCKAHRAYTGRGQFDYPRMLSGDGGPEQIHRMASRGLPPPAPVFVGNPLVCAQVLEGGSAAGKTSISFPTFAELASARVMRAIEVEGVH